MRRKVVCLCQGGNSRSVALAYLFKYKFNMDALSCGWEKNTPESLDMLYKWADMVCILQEEFIKYVPGQYHDKVVVFDVGPDVWFNSLHPELLNKLQDMILKKGDEK